MNRIAGWLMISAALLFMGVLARNVVPAPSDKITASEVDAGRYFHKGKTARTVSGAGDCIGPGCHDGASHRREPNLAAFRNMHSTLVDCLVCHALDGLNLFEGRKTESGRLHLRYKGSTTTAVAKGHPVLGAAAGCRRCHSEAGTRFLKDRGVPPAPSNFSDPIALRMQEGGARKWNP